MGSIDSFIQILCQIVFKPSNYTKWIIVLFQIIQQQFQIYFSEFQSTQFKLTVQKQIMHPGFILKHALANIFQGFTNV